MRIEMKTFLVWSKLCLYRGVKFWGAEMKIGSIRRTERNESLTFRTQKVRERNEHINLAKQLLLEV